MRNKEVLDATTDSRVYKLSLKRHRARTGEIHCDRCPYHRVENDNQDNWSHRKSWKRNTKRKGQYKKVIKM